MSGISAALSAEVVLQGTSALVRKCVLRMRCTGITSYDKRMHEQDHYTIIATRTMLVSQKRITQAFCLHHQGHVIILPRGHAQFRPLAQGL